MKECCMNCKNRYDIERLDYSGKGCVHTQPEGFICMGLACDGQASWMVGINENDEQCEMFSPKKGIEEDAE